MTTPPITAHLIATGMFDDGAVLAAIDEAGYEAVMA